MIDLICQAAVQAVVTLAPAAVLIIGGIAWAERGSS